MTQLQSQFKHFRNAFLSVAAISAVAITSAFALTPTLTLSGQSGTVYGLNIVGDANQQATLYYHTTSNPSAYTTLLLGSTNSSGNLSYTFNTANYGVVNNDSIYVTVNGQNSTSLLLNNTGTSTLSLSQTSVSLSSGQQSTVTAYNMAGNMSVSSSNSSVANVSVTGSTIYISGVSAGSANITVSGTNTSGQYVTGIISVTVNGTNSSTISFSQTTVSVNAGQQVNVATYNMAGNMSVSSSNTNIANATVSGSTIYITGVTSGSVTITVSGTNTSGQYVSGYIYVTVNGSGTTGNLYLSQTSLNLLPSQTTSVYTTGYGYSGNISAVSSNTSVANVTVSGSTISVTGVSAGSAVITVTSSNYYGQTMSGTISVNVSSVNQTGPYTVNVCGYTTAYSWVCQNVSVNNYSDYVFLSGLIQNNNGITAPKPVVRPIPKKIIRKVVRKIYRRY